MDDYVKSYKGDYEKNPTKRLERAELGISLNIEERCRKLVPILIKHKMSYPNILAEIGWPHSTLNSSVN